MSGTKPGAAKPAIGPAEAVEILQSALGYCQQAGLMVRAGNANGGITIIVPGVTIKDGRLEVEATKQPDPVQAVQH